MSRSQYRPWRHQQQVGGRVQPRDKIHTALVREQPDRHSREGREIASLPGCIVPHQIGRGPVHRVVVAGRDTTAP